MNRFSHLREISILPCLPAGLSVEDEMLSPTAPSFGLQHVYPNAALARVLGFLNISKATFFALVESRKGIKLTSSKADGSDPSDGNVTFETLQRAAAIVGRRVQLELVLGGLAILFRAQIWGHGRIRSRAQNLPFVSPIRRTGE